MGARDQTSVGVHEVRKTKVTIYYDKGQEIFTATFGGKRYNGATKKEVADALTAVIEAATSITWLGVIEVRRTSKKVRAFQGFKSVEVGLEVSRYFVTSLPKKKYVRISWDQGHDTRATPERKLEWAEDFIWNGTTEFKLPTKVDTSYSWHSAKYYLPYTDELWTGLQMIAKAFEQADTRLDAILSSEEGLMLLAGTGNQIFLPGAGETTPE